ncbi:MAG: hypothetical protein KDI62_24700, partial [Anaerolineae bacterium]|nr:hypothetical protein [Anaerolineae bacterium]
MHRSINAFIFIILALSGLFLFIACNTANPEPVSDSEVSDPGEELLGGQTTVFNTTPNAFGQPAPGLDRHDGLLFFVGNSFFN